MRLSNLRRKAVHGRQRTTFLAESTRGPTTYLDRLITNMVLNTKTQAIINSALSHPKDSLKSESPFSKNTPQMPELLLAFAENTIETPDLTDKKDVWL